MAKVVCIRQRLTLCWHALVVGSVMALGAGRKIHASQSTTTTSATTTAMAKTDLPTGHHFISDATAYCYSRLVTNQSCCIDERFSDGVQRQEFWRPDAEWSCDSDCGDDVAGRRGRDVLWVPTGAACSAPRILFVHGGSWMYGSPDTWGYGQLASKLAYATGALVMVPDYPLLSINPNHLAGNFSTIMDALVAALQWLASDSLPECKENTAARLFVAGDSSGGGSALSLVLMLRSRPHLLPQNTIAGAFFFSPWTNLKCDTPDYYYNSFSKIKVGMASEKGGKNDTNSVVNAYVGDIIFQDSPDKNRQAFRVVAEQYAGSTSSLTDPFKSPYHAGVNELSGCPPLYFVAGGSETILGDSVAVAQRAAASGVQVHLDIYPGMWHDFPMYSEGCGSGFKLWQAHAVFRTTGLFVKHISATGNSPLAVLDTRSPGSGSVPFTVINFSPETSRLMKGVDLEWEMTELFWGSLPLEDMGRLSGWAPVLVTSSLGGFTVLALQFVWRRLSRHKSRIGWMQEVAFERFEQVTDAPSRSTVAVAA